MPTNATSPPKLKAKERERQATELRLAGATYEEIGQRLGISGPGAFAAVMRVLRRQAARTAEDAGELRQIEVARLDRMQARLAAALHGSPAPLVLARLVDSALRVMKRRAELLGLDAPTRINVDLNTLTDEQLAAIAAGEEPAAVLAMPFPGADAGALLGSTTPPPPAPDDPDDGEDEGEAEGVTVNVETDEAEL